MHRVTSVAFVSILLLASSGAGKPARGAVVPAGTPPAWIDQVQRDIAAREYELSFSASPPQQGIEPSWQAPNRAQGFRTYFTPEGIRLVPRTACDASWRWGLTLSDHGRGERSVPAPAAALHASGRRMEYRRGALTEFYENSERGLEQGFVLPGPFPGSRAEPAHVSLTLWGDLHPRFAPDGQAIDFVTASGAPAVRYAELRVIDARGTLLRSWMEPGGGPEGPGLRLLFDDRDAAYPVTIDPLATTAAWTQYGSQMQALFGSAVATAGDVNGDGYADIIVGARQFDFLYTDIGRAFLYLGSSSGPSISHAWTESGEEQYAHFGSAVATAGDVNQDGYSDVLIGSANYSNGQEFEGAAYLFLGSATGLSHAYAWKVEGNNSDANLGASLGPAGDVNGDGYADAIVGAPGWNGGLPGEGRTTVYLGSASGLSSVPAWTGLGGQTSSEYGESVATAGDVNGDGYADIVVGAPGFRAGGLFDRGRAFVHLGSAAGPSPLPDWTADGEAEVYSLGFCVSTAGDVNGDGYSDVIVGEHRYGASQPVPDRGRATVYLGAGAGLAATPAWSFEGTGAFDFLGHSVATAGDVNGDGYADVIVGSPGASNKLGRAFVFLGSAGGLSLTPAWNEVGTQAMGPGGKGLGTHVGTAGDVNGDGFSDVIVASPYHDFISLDEGLASVYLGSPGGPAATAGWSATTDRFAAGMGSSVATAGDVNGDGYADVLVGSPQYDGGLTFEGGAFLYLGSASGLSPEAAWTGEGNQAQAFYGASVAGAGDVNCDGYSDVVIGAPRFDNGETDEGRVSVHLGGAGGLDPTPVFSAEGNQTNSQFGFRVASAGDVDGDGCSEVLVGAPSFNGGQAQEGRAFVYRGGPAGPAAAPVWTAESNQAGARFGISVATAGDVNRDGHADVIIGASDFDNGQTNEGRVFLYLGSAAGLAAAPAWTAENDQANSRFGSAVASAGDVNGDGRSDVIIGSPAYTASFMFQGRAYIYPGFQDSLQATASWIRDGGQEFASFGQSVSGAGDVNGDGLSDILVGEAGYDSPDSEEGRASLFFGASSGVGSTPAWIVEGNQFNAAFGTSVSSAGDVNGDGYADIVVGAPTLGNGHALLYYGNGGRGLSLRPRQAEPVGPAPIAPGGRTAGLQARLEMLGRTPFGRGRVRLECETRGLGAAFGGGALIRSATPIDTGTTGGALALLPSFPLPGSIHWRARLLYDGGTVPFQQRSRWITMPWNGWNEGDLSVTAFLGGVMWNDVDGDGVRDPAEPAGNGVVNLRTEPGDILVDSVATGADGGYTLPVLRPGPYRLEFVPSCFSLTLPDQGGNDALDSDPQPVSGRTAPIGEFTFTTADETRWSAGIVGNASAHPPLLPVLIASVRHEPASPGAVWIDLTDANDAGAGVTGYNLYQSTGASIPFEQWTQLLENSGDLDATVPGVQLPAGEVPPVGVAFYYQVTAENAVCGMEGPR